MGTPIINLPQTGKFDASSAPFRRLTTPVAVLGLHAIKEKPVAVNGKVEIRPVCTTSSLSGCLIKWPPDDVSCTHLRPSTSRRQRSSCLSCQGITLSD